MDSETIKAILNKADPNKNSSVHERQNALRMAEREMDKSGLSFASLGFSQEDAERIANQFSVAVGGGQREERASLNLFSRKPKPQNYDIQKQEPKTVYVPSSKPAKRKEEPYVSYVDQCEQAEWARVDKEYKDWAAWRAGEDAKNAEAIAATAKVIPYLWFFVLLICGLILYFGVIKPLTM